MTFQKQPDAALVDNNLKIVMGQEAIVVIYEKLKQLTPTQLLATFKNETKDSRLDPICCSFYHVKEQVFLKRNEPLEKQNISANDILILVPFHKFAAYYCYQNEIENQ